MKFTIDRNTFVNALNNVQRAISTKTTIPVLTGVKIAVTHDSIILTGSDSTLSIEMVLSTDEKNHLDIEETGTIVLPANFLNAIVRKLPEDELTLTVTNDLQAVITSGKATFELIGTPGSEYPRLPEIDSKATFNIPGDLFARVINYTLVSVSTQEIRPIFTGIHFEIGHDELKAVSTDSHRLSQRIVPLESPSELKDEIFEINIPGRSLSELTRLVEDSDNVEMMVTDNQVLFKIGTVYLYSRLLEGNYPNTDNLLPTSWNSKIQIEADEMLRAIERALIMSHQGKNNVVKLEITESGVVLSGKSDEVGVVTENLNVVDHQGDDLSISFNPDYMRQALRTFGSQEVEIHFQNPIKQFIILPADATEDEQFHRLQLITPIRTLTA